MATYRTQAALITAVAKAVNQHLFKHAEGALGEKSIEEALTSSMTAENVRFAETPKR